MILDFCCECGLHFDLVDRSADNLNTCSSCLERLYSQYGTSVYYDCDCRYDPFDNVEVEFEHRGCGRCDWSGVIKTELRYSVILKTVEIKYLTVSSYISSQKDKE